MITRGLFAGVLFVAKVVACGGGGSVVGECRMQGLTMTPTLADGTALNAIDYGGNRPERGEHHHLSVIRPIPIAASSSG